MCRLALMNKKGMETLEKMYGLDKFFDYLEAQLGGHGNGYIMLDDKGEAVGGAKAVTLGTTEIADDMRTNEDAEWFVFHTRLASIGGISTKNCHPFWDKEATAFLCANGTERCKKVMDNKKVGETDTETVFELGTADGESLYNTVKGLTATYIGKHNNRMFAVRNLGSLEKVKFGNGGIVLASSFPYGLREKAERCDEFVVEFLNEVQ